MWWRGAVVALLVAAVAGKGKKHRHQKPGRAVLDRLSGTTLSEVTIASGTTSLLPAPLDVAPYSTVVANATCGEGGSEEFCRETPGKRGIVCDVCEGAEGSQIRRHSASLAVDNDPATWWQSPVFSPGEERQHVELVATLPGKMELLHVIIKSGPSPRPLAWSLEVSPSESGDDWRLVRAFGDRDHCRKLWDLRPERRRRKARGVKRTSRAEKTSCSTQFISPKPLENGEMHVGIGEGVPARRVRISFRAAHPPARHSFYTVRELTLAARCLCHGHAKHCTVDRKSAKCDCIHGTCGAHCQRCCSGEKWRAHQPCDVGDANTCSCGGRPCSYDDSGAILCVNCTENRAGPLCDRCLAGFYNILPDDPCLPCDCDPEGSDGSCKWDRKHHRIACSCNPGFTGPQCDSCSDKNAVFPNCLLEATTVACKCDPRGIVDPTRVCDEVCECKLNVIGERCDTCATGYYGLSAELATGCRPCYCSRVGAHCVADPTAGEDVTLPLGEAWLISNNDTSETAELSVDEQGKPFLVSYEVEGWESFYFVTTAYAGQRSSAYGGEIRARVEWGVARGDSGGSASRFPDFLLVANDGTKLSYGNTSHESPGLAELAAPLLEGAWYSSELVARARLLDVLADLKAVMIRAHFHYDQDEVRLESVEIKGAPAGVREICSCPAGYEGPQCTACAWTHVRLQRALGSAPAFECVPCACNMHAGCDAVDGPCGPCQHNTTGPHCERCLPGHYGNPVQGACKPCACPLYEASNNFSPNCALASAEGDDFVCTQCPDGYTGDHCELCDSGYWGSPGAPGGSCAPCACGGGPCRADSGRCLVCPPHTEGERCDQCQEGYWSGGENGSCIACACGRGALSGACDARSGQCACAGGWSARACDECAAGHGGVEEGCPPCNCGEASLSAACEALTGHCACAEGAAPPRCETCLDEYYELTRDGCLGCNCSSIGSESNVCDIRSGQCRCRPHVTGRACDTCEEGYWGLQQGGCRSCECGAGAAACDPISGLCACAVGVGGPRCDRCLTGYYGFGPTGCLPCPACTDGRVCSPVTGRCVCPGRTRGAGCKLCARGYWGRAAGCKSCACGLGAVSDTCDMLTGQCQCRTGWTGRGCDHCATGYFGPRCRPCGCALAGTRGCDRGICACDARGQCPCKENVVGEKCDRCLEGTFGLSETNPAGCTACFCFGRSAKCTQASVARAALHAATPLHLKLLRGDSISNMDQDSLLAVHTNVQEATISVPWPPVPVYAELGELFLGDHVLSYGGALRFRVEEEGGEPLPPHVLTKFPLVSIYGNNLVLDYYERLPAINGSHAVYLHESLWEVRGRGAVASRGALMHALLDVKRLLLRLSTRASVGAEPLHVLLLNVSLETAVAGLTRGAPAPGVERCSCPRGYDAASCHRPAAGFWIPPAPPRLHHVSGTILINVEGAAKPCECSGRASTCHPQTGHCLNCTNNTAGAQCERCAEGFHGAPERGCQPCPCPNADKPRATACAFSHGRLHCYCKPGYTGPTCEQCAPGWKRHNEECAPCKCDSRGAHSARCDAHARCHCRPHATGDRCQLCSLKRHYLDEDGCRPCDNCTQTLMDSAEALTADLHRRADLSELNRIPQPFPALREFAHNASTLQTSLGNLRKSLEKSMYLEPSIERLEISEHELFTKANRFKEEASRRDKEAQSLSLESMSALEEVLKQRRMIGEQVAALDDFARGEKHLSAHRALKEARHLLKIIKDLSLIDYLAGATDVSDSANLQSTSVQEYNYRIDDEIKRIQKLQSDLEEWEKKAEDVSRLAEIVWSAGDVVSEMKKRVTPRLSVVRDIGLRCRIVLEDITKLNSHNMTDETRSALLHTQNLAVGFPALLSELQNLTAAAEEKEGILYNLTPKYKEKYLDAVEKHVTMLKTKAKEYKNLFAGTRAVASAGVQAARAWSEVADGVRSAAAAADAALIAVATAAKLARGPQPLLATADDEKAASEMLKQRGSEVLMKADELRRQLEAAQRGTDSVSVGIRALGWRERALASGAESGVASGVGSNAINALKQASTQAERVFASTRALYDEAAETRRKVRYQLRRNLAALQRLGDTALGAAEEHVSQIRGNTLRGGEVSEALAAAAAARAREHDTASATLRPALQALKEQIERARHAATTISVSVTSPAGAAGCARAYAVWSAPGVTRASLALSFDSAVRDGTLLYIPDQETDRFIRLSVEKGKLRVRWNVGGGAGKIEHPEPLLPTRDDADHTTYRIELERIWGTVNLHVERAGNSVITSSNTTSTSPESGLLRPGLWWLGEPEHPLPACVHSLHADHGAIGLWAFAKQPSVARCTGCTQRWYSGSRGSRGTEGLVRLNGAGYVVLPRSRRPSDRRRFSLALAFRTTDTDALLFLAHDHENNRSVSVWVRACRVVFLVQYAGARLEIAAGGRHCDGRPAHVQATRVFNGLERGSLRVNGEETLGSPSTPVQSAAALPDLSKATYWVGGIPPEGEALGYEALPLLGCIGGLMVDREGYDLLDTPMRHGVEPGCAARPLRSAVLEGEGFIELPSPAIRRKTSIGISFRARASSGLLLYRAPTIAIDDNEVDEDEDDHHYLVLALVKGELVVLANAGKGELRLQLNGTKFDDGDLYTVRLIRAHKQLEVWLDEKRLGAGALAGGALAARARGLFLGGAPRRPGRALPAPAFTGTIADFIVDTAWVGLETSVRRAGARLGRADAAPRSAAPPPPALHAEPGPDAACAKMSSYTVEAGAVKFGDTPGSYATLRVAKDKGAKAEFSFTLQLRTFANDGLIMLLPGSKLKPKHYTALSIREGRLRLVVRGRRRRELSLAASVADGTWRSVTVRISRTRIILSSAGAAATARAPPHSRAARLYVGGPPPAPLAPHVPNSIIKIGGFVGCIRRVTINGRAEDLVRDARAHTAVGQCFPHIERGAYFAGDAYAEWAGDLSPGGEDSETVELRLQFRAAAGTGVIAAAAGALLELKDGFVVITVGGAKVESRQRVCDGQWHAVRAHLARGAATLALDAAPEERAAPALLPAPAPSAPPSPALYVGGLPEGGTELAEGRENFKGCIRDVHAGGIARDFRNARALHNVLLDSCPTEN